MTLEAAARPDLAGWEHLVAIAVALSYCVISPRGVRPTVNG
jgi:hypothetical protein